MRGRHGRARCGFAQCRTRRRNARGRNRNQDRGGSARRFAASGAFAAGRGDGHACHSLDTRSLHRPGTRRHRPPRLRARHSHAAGTHALDDRDQRNGHRHRRHVDSPARHRRYAHQRDDQRRSDEQPRFALDVLVRHARPHFVGRHGAGAARRRGLDKRHGSIRRCGEHDHRRPVDRVRRLGVALLRLLQHQQAGRAALLGSLRRPLGTRRTPDAHRLRRLHRPRGYRPEILYVPGGLLRR